MSERSRTPKNPPGPRPEARRGGLWPKLRTAVGLGAVGLGAVGVATWLGRRTTAPSASGKSLPHPPPAPPPIDRLPDDVELAWIPGPQGAIRLGERHRDGKIDVVYLHGLGGRLEQWAAQLAALGPAIHGVAIDLPGHGGSDARTGEVSIPELAETVSATAEGLGLRRFVLVAHSLGALVALEYAHRHPDRVAGLFLVDPASDQTRLPEADRKRFLDAARQDPASEFPWQFRQLLSGAEPEVAAKVLESLGATPENVLVATLESGAAYSPLPALDSFGGPVWGVVSELNALPIALHRLSPAITTHYLGGASHWLMMDRPTEVQEIFWDFLEEVEARRS